jgi:hypothetical protein
MKVLHVRNVHDALPKALRLLQQEGVERESRNGPVKMLSCPVTTVYERPMERVLFWPERDANPFYHLYEALWMLAGRNDVMPLTRYAKHAADYSDDGKTWHGAYGHRWRWNKESNHICAFDQLTVIADRLKKFPDDRRSVLQMWSANWDLRSINEHKDIPCNTTATLQRDAHGRLDLTVFCRSNDIVWGAYGANAVHFSFLQEYMALWIGCPVGKLYQVSVNWHGYLNTLNDVWPIAGHMDCAGYTPNPYIEKLVRVEPLCGTIEEVDRHITDLLRCADTDSWTRDVNDDLPWSNILWTVLRAHSIYKSLQAPQKYTGALTALGTSDVDWIVAAREWISRRYDGYNEFHTQRVYGR